MKRCPITGETIPKSWIVSRKVWNTLPEAVREKVRAGYIQGHKNTPEALVVKRLVIEAGRG